MTNKLILFLLSLVGWMTVNAQAISTPDEAAALARQIVKASGRPANFAITPANVPNAAAVFHQGQRYIFYNPQFINRLAAASGTRWAAISVLAHEIGHHLNKGDKMLSTELEADEFSGYVLQKMGATLDEAQAAMSLLAFDRPTHTHPAKDDRLYSIAKGWEDAGGIVDEQNSTARRTAPATVDTRSNDSIEKNKLVATLTFNVDPSTPYYLTNDGAVLRVKSGDVERIGQLSRSNDRDYPFIIADESDNKVYISTEGILVNRLGKTIGKLRLTDS